MNATPQWNRRQFLRTVTYGGIGLAGTAALPGCSSNASPTTSAGKLLVTAVVPSSGPLAQFGADTAAGAELACKLHGDDIKQGVAFSRLDTGGEVDQARRVVTTAIQSDGARVFVGGASSSVALAISSVVNSNKGMFTTAVGADEVTGTECRKSTFRWSAPAYVAVRETVRPLADANPSFKRWYAIYADYVFGQSMLKSSKEILGDKFVGASGHAVTETQFSSYLNNAMAEDPDVILLLNPGVQQTSIITQALQQGLKEKVTFLAVWSDGLTQFQGIGADAIEDVYFGCQYWHTASNPANDKFVAEAQKAFGQPPNYPQASGYIEVMMTIEAAKQADSIDPAKMIAALEGYEFDGITGKETVRAEDHQVQKNFYLMRGKAKSAMKDEFDFMEIVSEGNSVVPIESTGCKMPESW